MAIIRKSDNVTMFPCDVCYSVVSYDLWALGALAAGATLLYWVEARLNSEIVVAVLLIHLTLFAGFLWWKQDHDSWFSKHSGWLSGFAVLLSYTFPLIVLGNSLPVARGG